MATTFEWIKVVLEYIKLLKPAIIWLFRFILRHSPVFVMSAALGSITTYQYYHAKDAEIPPQKVSATVSNSQIGNTRRIVIEKKQIIEQKIDYAKIQAMIDKAIKEHEDKYHR